MVQIPQQIQRACVRDTMNVKKEMVRKSQMEPYKFDKKNSVLNVGLSKRVHKKTSNVEKEFNDTLKQINQQNIQFEVSEFNETLRECESPKAKGKHILRMIVLMETTTK